VEITNYADLLKAAHAQPELQRLLFVFAEAELPGEHTAEQKKKFHARSGGALTPIMSVDKLPNEVLDFGGLVEESRQTGRNWDIVFVASMSGSADMAPSSQEADKPLESMIEAIKNGDLKNYVTFNRSGELVQLE
jgi:hypothetical protein